MLPAQTDPVNIFADASSLLFIDHSPLKNDISDIFVSGTIFRSTFNLQRNSMAIICESASICTATEYSSSIIKGRPQYSVSISFSGPSPHSSVCHVQDLRIGDRWFDPRLRQYSFQGLVIVIATGFIPLHTLFCRRLLCRKAARRLE